MTKVRLYLDVDGVINADSPHLRWLGAPVSTGQVVLGGNRYRIRWSQEMVDRLSELDLELVWATTWRGYAPEHLSPLIGGLGSDSRWLDSTGLDYTWPSILWKHDAVIADQLADPSPFIWIDDELQPHHVAWAKEHGGLALPSPEWTGITPEMVDKMRSYIDEHSD